MRNYSKLEAMDAILRVSSGSNYEISCVTIGKLFGYLSFILKKDNSDFLDDRLVIMYGDNGAGKTTLLNLIFHSLSPYDNREHRKYIYNTEFETFGIELKDTMSDRTITIIYYRDLEEFSESGGGYKVAVTFLGDSEPFIQFNTNEFSDLETRRKYTAFEMYSDLIRSLNISVYLLSTDRKFLGDNLYSDDKEHILVQKGLVDNTELSLYSSKNKDTKKRDLNEILKWTSSTILQNTFIKMQETEERLSDPYIKFVELLLEKGNLDGPPQYITKVNLLKRLNRVSENFEKLAKLGIAYDNKISRLIYLVSNLDDKLFSTAEKVIPPYLYDLENKVEILMPVYKSFYSFIESINRFLSYKQIQYSPEIGLYFTSTQSNRYIHPNNLSSGEQQIIKMMCYALVTAQKNTLFIIDEPEISLNIKWQRRLIKSLLDISSFGETKFIFATHSIEMLAQYTNEVIKLESLDARDD